MYININKFYLNTRLKRFKYLRLKLDNFLEFIIEKYKLKENPAKNATYILRYEKVCVGYRRQD